MADAPLRVLIVDDEAPARRRLRELLDDCAAALPLTIVGEAANGRETLDLLHTVSADLLLVDINMPEMSGREVLSELGRRGSRVPVLVMSGFSEMEVNRHFEGLLIAGILEKPFSTKDLARGIERIRTGSAQAGVH